MKYQKLNKFIILIGIIFLNIVVASEGIDASKIKHIGLWKVYDSDSKFLRSIIEIKLNSDGLLEGNIIKIFKRDSDLEDIEICSKCPEEMANKPTEGLLFLWDLSKSDDSLEKWNNGKILDVLGGGIYGCELSMRDNNTLQVETYYFLLPFIGETYYWYRVDFEKDINLLVQKTL